MNASPIPIMATIAHQWIRATPIARHSPLSSSTVKMRVNQKDIDVQMESLSDVLLCSLRPDLSRKKPPGLPPEDERSSIVHNPTRIVFHCIYYLYLCTSTLNGGAWKSSSTLLWGTEGVLQN